MLTQFNILKRWYKFLWFYKESKKKAVFKKWWKFENNFNRDELIYNPLVSNSKMLIGDRSLLFFKDSPIESLFIACKSINHNSIIMYSEKWESFMEVIN